MKVIVAGGFSVIAITAYLSATAQAGSRSIPERFPDFLLSALGVSVVAILMFAASGLLTRKLGSIPGSVLDVLVVSIATAAGTIVVVAVMGYERTEIEPDGLAAVIGFLLSLWLWPYGIARIVVEFIECRRTKAAEPSATDNPDDAQRLREDH